MNSLEIIILGALQGITEFLPISSSGHLVILQSLFGLKEMLFYDVLLHFATLLAIFVLFFKDIIEYVRNIKILLYIILLTIPTGIIGLFIKKYLSFVYDSMLASGVFLLLTGSVLFLADKSSQSVKTKSVKEINFFDAIIIGVAQGIAVLPGISRSGATLATSLLLGIERKDAVKFIFIASIPAILAATFLETKEAVEASQVTFNSMFLYGMLTAFVVGIIFLKFLISFVNNKKLRYFSYYCWLVGLVAIIIYFIKS